MCVCTLQARPKSRVEEGNDDGCSFRDGIKPRKQATNIPKQWDSAGANKHVHLICDSLWPIAVVEVLHGFPLDCDLTLATSNNIRVFTWLPSPVFHFDITSFHTLALPKKELPSCRPIPMNQASQPHPSRHPASRSLTQHWAGNGEQPTPPRAATEHAHNADARHKADLAQQEERARAIV